MDVYFNELSVGFIPDDQLIDSLGCFKALLGKLNTFGVKNVITDINFKEYHVTPSQTFYKLLANDYYVDSDLKTYLIDMLGTIDGNPMEDMNIIRAEYDGNSCYGLGAASQAVCDTLAISMHPSVWSQDSCTVKLTYLDEEANEYQEESICKHVSMATQLEAYRNIIAPEIPIPRNGKILAMKLSSYYPHLVFSDQAQKQIQSFKDSGVVEQIFRKLNDAENASIKCEDGVLKPDLFATYVTPESSSRNSSDKLDITFPDGNTRHCGWHLRFTPGGGRIHIAADEGQQRHLIYVGYVGAKINA